MVKNLPANAEDLGLISRLGRSPGDGNGNLLQYSCLENSRDREAWWTTDSPGDRKELDMTEHTHTLLFYVLVFWPRGTWDLSLLPAFEGEILTTGPPRKSLLPYLMVL